MKGKSPAISKRIRKIFRRAQYKCFLIDEFRTSKLCNRCEGVLENQHYYRKREYIPDHSTKWNPYKYPFEIKELASQSFSKKSQNNKYDQKSKIWGLLTCNNKCGLTKNMRVMNYKHNRDRNSCLNMEKIVENLRLHKERPKNYKR